MIYGILTSKQHAVKLINFMNIYEPDIKYIVSTSKYAPQEFEYDIGVCYCYNFLIDVDELGNENKVYYNYHPASLSNSGASYGDWGNYARGLYDLQTGKLKEWGVSLHCIDRGVDTGTVLRVLRVPLMSIPIDSQELGDASHYFLLQLFKKTIHALQFKPKTKEELDKLC